MTVVEEDKEVAVHDYKTGVEEDDGGRNRKVVNDKSVQQDGENDAGTNDLGEETLMETSQAVANIESIGEQTKKRKSSDWTSDSFNEAILEDDGDMNPESFNRGNTNITSYMNADCGANFPKTPSKYNKKNFKPVTNFSWRQECNKCGRPKPENVSSPDGGGFRGVIGGRGEEVLGVGEEVEALVETEYVH